MKMFEKVRKTIVYDLLLLTFFVLPSLIVVTIGSTCEYLNEGQGAAGCVLGSFGTEIAEISFMYFTILSFGGFLIVAPILLYAFSKTWTTHASFFKNKQISLAAFVFSVPGLIAAFVIGSIAVYASLILFETAKYWINQI
jgi:hypothetical protein